MSRKDRRSLAGRYRVTDGDGFRLADHDTATTGGPDKAEAEVRLAKAVDRLSSLQQALYAHGEWSVLVIFQAMDAAGKDGTIRHVMSGVNPQGVRVTSFKQPGPVQLAHDFLWRIHAALPERGQIGIFNRSHYEDVLVARVHPEVVEAQKLPKAVRAKGLWKHRYQDIRHFESYLARQGTVVLKFFLHISKEEQRERLLARLEEPDKNWKFSSGDLKERARWDDYQEAYQDAIAATATKEAPWFVVPADHKPFARLVVSEAIIEAIERLDLRMPDPEDPETLAEARRLLEAD